MFGRLSIVTMIIASMAVAGSLSLRAGEFGGGATTPAAIPNTTAEAEVGPVVVYATDPGVNTVYQAQAARNDVVYGKGGDSAENLLRRFMVDKNYQRGWDPDTGRYFSIGIGVLNTANPAADPNFLDFRDAAARAAVLGAKADIINFIKTEMSAYDRIRTPGTIANEELGPEYEVLAVRIRGLCAQVAALAERFYGAEEAAVLRNASEHIQIREVNENLSRMVRDLGQGRIPTERRAEIERMQSLYKDVTEARDSLEARANVIRESGIDTQTDTFVERLSEMALTGATVIQQAESWDGRNRYEVAVLMCWSHNLERMARATLTGQPVEIQGNLGRLSRTEWLASRDLSAMTGPHQFLDDRGRRDFLGIAAQPVGRNAAEERHFRTAADLLASQMAAFSLYADVRAYSMFRRTVDAMAGGGEGATLNRMPLHEVQESLSQSINRMKIQGMQSIERVTVTHPDLGIQMRVSVYCISAEDAEAAMRAEEANVRAAIAVRRHQSFLQGRADEFQRQIDAATNDPAAYRQGVVGAQSAVQNPPNQPQPGAANPAGTRPDGFSRMGGDVPDDF